jgi:large subunit ribosomal protein L3|uniref:Large ribosomal subunit protein uL3c n=1 Tax=Didymosphenia geminata TaxID=1115533 RepID=A0A023HAS5_9STRA|nr:ribosomal protein L3 [Didymosphenia geminata]AGH28796.1 ribosomal protein L3 [Didymosphenia geminata]
MGIGLLGNKIGMTQIFDEVGNIIPVTILKVGPCVVTQIKTKSKDGYDSIQIGYGNVSSKSLTQPELGHLQKSKIQPLKYLKEFRINEESKFEIGQVLNVNSFSPGQFINVRGKSIGKGFSGLQKRYNFTRGPMSHGSKNHRAPGSIGMGTTPGRVLPGKKMAGHVGDKITTITKLKVIQINLEENILVIKGSVPGKPGNLLSIVPFS